jgi:hypothetical protein
MVVAEVVAGPVIGAVIVADVVGGPSSLRSRALPGPELCEPGPELCEPGPELSTSTSFPPTPVQRGSFACSASSHGPLMSPGPLSSPTWATPLSSGRCAPAQRGSLACSASSHGPLTSTVPVVLVVAAGAVVVDELLPAGAAIT